MSPREVELEAILEWIDMALDEKPLSEFASSYPIVRRVEELVIEKNSWASHICEGL